MKNSKKLNAAKVVANLLLTLFFAGLVYFGGLLFFDIDPAPLTYVHAMFYFLVAGIIVWLLKWVFSNLVNKWMNGSYFLFPLTIEVIMFVAFVLLMPFTGDAGA